MSEHFDVLIVGAGLSGVGAGYYLQRDCPEKSYIILENRDAIGGTWDLFRYPGIRSDSDMFTLGYSFKPWREEKAIADGPSIWKYVNETAREHGIDKHIRFRHRVVRCAWSSDDALWTVEAEHGGAVKRFTANFVLMAAGYYNYEEGYLPQFKGRERFKGVFLHAQHWPEDLDYSGKRVVVIGSGATAVTLVPAMTDKAAHVVMLQRSPTYMISLPAVDRFANGLRKVLPERWAYNVNRALRVFFQQFFFRLARNRPKLMRKRILGRITPILGEETVSAHFTPRYNPWEQRLCLVPDNDMFLAVRDGKASIETDTIDTLTEKGVKLGSGKEIEADIIVAATGLNMRMLGGAEVTVDGARVDPGKTFAYKGAMLSDVPNMAFVFGYTNASWTLRADLINQYVCRLINYLDMYDLASATPRVRGELEPRPFADFSSGYFARAEHLLPKQTTKAPWKQNQSYAHDIMDLRFGAIEDGVLEFKRAPATAAPKPAAPTREAVAAEGRAPPRCPTCAGPRGPRVKVVSLFVLVALLVGLLVGAGVRATGDAAFLQEIGLSPADIQYWVNVVHPPLANIASVIEPFGGLWLNTLRMTVIPLVVSLLIVGIASVADTARTGGLVARALFVFTIILFAMAIYSVAATQAVLSLWPVERDAAQAFIAGIGDRAVTIAEPPTFASWLEGLAPYNPVKAAAEDGVLALVVFSIFFGFAATQLQPALREPLVTFFRAVSEAMIVIVHWVLLAGPIGVFALALGVGLRAGFGAVPTLAQYVVIVTGVTAVSCVIAWLIAVTWGRQPIVRFTSAAAPVWAIAASTQSSLASLPAMLEAALRGLRIPASVADVILPLAVAVFRFTSPVANLAVCFFVAHLYGLEPSVLQIVSAVFVAYAVSIAAVGLPGQISFIASIAPICLALGVPTEVLGVLIAVEVIPDIFRTLGNVTGDLAATSILARNAPREDVELKS